MIMADYSIRLEPGQKLGSTPNMLFDYLKGNGIPVNRSEGSSPQPNLIEWYKFSGHGVVITAQETGDRGQRFLVGTIELQPDAAVSNATIEDAIRKFAQGPNAEPARFVGG